MLLAIGYISVNTTITEEIGTHEYQPLLMYNNKMYRAVRFNEDKLIKNQGLVQIAVVESYIDDGKPIKNKQVNSSEFLGCPIFQLEEFAEYLFVLYNDSFYAYKLLTL